jgi:uncharacterized Zn-binding protein involved in type VI secretion
VTKPGPSVNRDLVAALGRKAQRVGERAPSVRGADWRLATVTAVTTSGTVTADGIPNIRCLETYSTPAVGDVAVITHSSSGNWLAVGRLLTATGTGWSTLTPASGFTAGQGTLGPPQYRVINAWGTPRVELRGSFTATTAVTAGTTFTTVPTAARPSTTRTFPVARQYTATAKGTTRASVSTAGVMTIYGNASDETSWLCLDGCYYDL